MSTTPSSRVCGATSKSGVCGDIAEAWDEFAFTPFSVKANEEWPTLVQRIGAYDALPQEAAETKLRPLLLRASRRWQFATGSSMRFPTSQRCTQPC